MFVKFSILCIYFVLITVYWSAYNFSGADSIYNCTNCWYGCDHSSGNCSGQCAHGFFGPKCEQECPQCLDCDKLSGDCVSCHDRHYGKRCEFKCNENCMVGCRISGDCYKCNEGFYGMTCNLTCPSPNCRNGCERHTGNCTGWGCDSGFWGTMCNKSCPQNCGFTSCHQKDGTCQTCKDGYSGKTCEERCNYEHCSLCQFDVTTCFNCYHGWWGEHCDKKCTEHCSHPYCSQHTGKCGKCDHGYHGPYCEGTCNSVCETCSDNNTCDTCKTGFYGEDCKQRCPIRCTDCERDGKCKVCNSGYFGEECRCELSQCASNKESFCSSCKNETSWYPQEKGCCPCSDYCSSNSGDLLCNQTGCINECKDGYFGKHCLEPCSEHCLEGVKETCNNETGECQNGCKKGWHLPNCDYNCSLHFPHCNSCKEYLDNKNKPYVVCETCELGYYKELYSGLCKPCEHCQGGNMCDGTIGYCKWGCQKGWYAKREHYLCENPCPDNCTGGICEEIGGKCKTGCRPGSYGPHCLILCPSGCLNSTCEFRSGKCVLGCVPGQRGAYCNESCNAQCGVRGCREDDGLCKDCIQGYYGDQCSEPCSSNCVGKTCNQTGFCSAGCVPGWTGLLCEVSMSTQSEQNLTASYISNESSKSIVTIVLSTLLAIAVILVFVLALIVWRIRRTGSGNFDVVEMSRN